MNEIIPVVIGGILALAGGIFTKLFETQNEKKAIKHALAGEMSAVAEVFKEIHQQKVAFEIFNVTDQTSPSQVLTNQNYFLIYEGNSSKIGYLKPEAAGKVARFYTHAKFLMQELLDYKHSPHTKEQGERQVTHLHTLVPRVIAMGEEALKALDV